MGNQYSWTYYFASLVSKARSRQGKPSKRWIKSWRVGMNSVECTKAALEAAGEIIGEEGPVHMVNMVRFRDRADYGGKFDLAPCSGREAYFQRYAPAFNKVAQGEDYGLFWVGNVRGMLVSPDGQAWDDIVIVRYASFNALRRILESAAYERDAAPHRRAALAAWQFIATTQPNLPK